MSNTSRTRSSQPSRSTTSAMNGMAFSSKPRAVGRAWRLSPLCVAVAQVFAAATCAGLGGAAFAAPQGGKVVAGQAQINTGTLQTTVVQSTNRAVIDWTSFNLAPYESVRFVQPSSTAATLNRVRSSAGTEIAGRITANGQVYLVNPNGILFTRDATVNVGSLVASTADIANDAFMNERAESLNFNIPGTAGARVVNRGTINVAERGMAALLGAQVSNEGFITAKLGRIALAAGDGFTLSLSGNQLINLILTEGQLQRVTDASGTPLAARVDAGGTINAQGGRVELTADTVAKLLDSAINVTGDVRATTFQSEGGVIRLQGGSRTDLSVTGTVQAGGTATGAGLSATGVRDVTLASTTIDLSQGGAVSISAQRNINVNSSLNGRGVASGQPTTLNLSAQGNISLGSNVTVATENAALTLSAGQLLSTGSGSTASSGTAATVLEGSSGVTLNGAVVSTGAVTVRSATGGVAVSTALAGVAAQGNQRAVTPASVTVDAAAAVNLAGVTAGVVDIKGASVASSRDLVAAGALTVEARSGLAGSADNRLNVAGGAVTVRGAAGTNLGVVQSTGAIRLSSRQGGVSVSSAIAGSAGEIKDSTTLAAASLAVEAAGAVELNGAKLGAGGLTVGQDAAVGSLRLNGASIVSAGAVSARATGDVSLNPLVSSTGNMAISSTAGNITVGGAGQTTTLASQGGSLTLSATNGGITVQAGSTLSSGAAATTLSGAAGVTVSGNIVSTGDVTVESSGGDLTVNAAIAGVAGNPNGPTQVTLRATGADQDVAVAGVKAGSITIAAARNVRGLSNVADSPASLVSQSGTIMLTAGGRIGASAPDAPVNQGLAVSAATDLTANGAQGIRLHSIQANGDVNLGSSAGGVGVAGAVSGVSSTATSLEAAPAARSLTILAAGDVALNGAKLGNGGLVVGIREGNSAPVGSLSLGAASILSTGAIDARASGGVTVNGLVRSSQASSIQSTANGVSFASGAHLRSEATSGAGVTVRAAQGLTLAAGSTISGEGPSTALNAGGAISVQGNITSTGDIDIASTGGSVTVSSAISGVNRDGHDIRPSRVRIDATGEGQSISLIGGVQASHIAVNAGGDITTGLLRTASDSDPTAQEQGSLTVTSSAGSLTSTSVVGGAAVTLSALGGLRLGNLQANGLIKLSSAAGEVRVDSAVSGVTDREVSLTVDNTPVAAGLDIQAAGAVELNGANLGTQGLALGSAGNAIGGPVRLQGASIISAGGIFVRSLGNIDVNSVLRSTAAADVTVEAAGHITLNRSIVTTLGDISLTTAGGNILVTGADVHATAPVLVAGGDAATISLRAAPGKKDDPVTPETTGDLGTGAAGRVSVAGMVARGGISIVATRDVVLNAPLGGASTGYDHTSRSATGYSRALRPEVGTLNIQARAIELNGLNLDGNASESSTDVALDLRATRAIVSNDVIAVNKGPLNLEVSGTAERDGIYLGNDLISRGFDFRDSDDVIKRRVYQIEMRSNNINVFDNNSNTALVPELYLLLVNKNTFDIPQPFTTLQSSDPELVRVFVNREGYIVDTATMQPRVFENCPPPACNNQGHRRPLYSSPPERNTGFIPLGIPTLRNISKVTISNYTQNYFSQGNSNSQQENFASFPQTNEPQAVTLQGFTNAYTILGGLANQEGKIRLADIRGAELTTMERGLNRLPNQVGYDSATNGILGRGIALKLMSSQQSALDTDTALWPDVPSTSTSSGQTAFMLRRALQFSAPDGNALSGNELARAQERFRQELCGAERTACVVAATGSGFTDQSIWRYQSLNNGLLTLNLSQQGRDAPFVDELGNTIDLSGKNVTIRLQLLSRAGNQFGRVESILIGTEVATNVRILAAVNSRIPSESTVLPGGITQCNEVSCIGIGDVVPLAFTQDASYGVVSGAASTIRGEVVHRGAPTVPVLALSGQRINPSLITEIPASSGYFGTVSLQQLSSTSYRYTETASGVSNTFTQGLPTVRGVMLRTSNVGMGMDHPTTQLTLYPGAVIASAVVALFDTDKGLIDPGSTVGGGDRNSSRTTFPDTPVRNGVIQGSIVPGGSINGNGTNPQSSGSLPGVLGPTGGSLDQNATGSSSAAAAATGSSTTPGSRPPGPENPSVNSASNDSSDTKTELLAGGAQAPFGTSLSELAVGQRPAALADLGRGGPLGGVATQVFRKRFPLAATDAASACVAGVVSSNAVAKPAAASGSGAATATSATRPARNACN